MLPHAATYALFDARGNIGGREELRIERGAGWHAISDIATTSPQRLDVHVSWQLDARLRTRVLTVAGRTDYGDGLELELAITGNGLLAHRVAPDGPTQIELGWGPEVELDHLSMLFPAITLARLGLALRDQRLVRTVVIDAERLELDEVERRYEARELVNANGRDLLLVRCATPATGHELELLAREDGVVESYGALARLESVELLK